MEDEYIELEKLDLVKKELTETKYIFKRRLNLEAKFVFILFAFFGTVALFNENWLLCPFFYFLASGVIILYRGVLIDTRQHKLKDFLSVFGYKYGYWYNLDDFSFVLVSTSVSVAKSGFESIS